MDKKLGYVTTLPENLGTSMRSQIIINAPNLKSKTDVGKKEEEIQQQ